MAKKPTLMEYVNYEIVRRNGKFNMITEIENASKEAGLSIKQFKNVINNYQWCINQWYNCIFKIIKTYNKCSKLCHEDVNDDNGNVIKFEIDYGIDELSRIRSQFPDDTWELKQVIGESLSNIQT